jgi:transposase InsO family protein
MCVVAGGGLFVRRAVQFAPAAERWRTVVVSVEGSRSGVLTRDVAGTVYEWAYARPYTSETARRQALDPGFQTYNLHRGHTALKGLPPASRVTNLSGQYT